MSLDIKFNRIDKTYRPGEKVSGVVVCNASEAFKYSSLSVSFQGFVTLQLSARNMGVFDAFSSNMKPAQLLDVTIPLGSGKFPAGLTEIPFQFTLKPLGNESLHDSYHGVYVNIRYGAQIDITRGMFGGVQTVKKTEFYVQLLRDEEITTLLAESKPMSFTLTPASLQNVREGARKKVPEFLFSGIITRTMCDIDKPLLGEITINKCAIPIKSIELQLARVESCVFSDNVAREATEIQNIQVADGDVLRDIAIPLHMVFPRHFTCSTIIAPSFRVEFQVNLIISFADNHMITENFPIILVR